MGCLWVAVRQCLQFQTIFQPIRLEGTLHLGESSTFRLLSEQGAQRNFQLGVECFPLFSLFRFEGAVLDTPLMGDPSQRGKSQGLHQDQFRLPAGICALPKVNDSHRGQQTHHGTQPESSPSWPETPGRVRSGAGIVTFLLAYHWNDLLPFSISVVSVLLLFSAKQAIFYRAAKMPFLKIRNGFSETG